MRNDAAHVCINVDDYEKMAKFYLDVFGGELIPPERHLEGEWFENIAGFKGAELKGLCVMTDAGLLLELFKWVNQKPAGEKTLDTAGIAHVAFIVDDVQATYDKFIACGGSKAGEVTKHYYPSRGRTLTAVYCKDPEGNFVEIQRWDDGELEGAI